jgi:lipoprotein NlpI
VDAYNDRGRAYFAKHDYDRAIVEWTEAVRINPNFTIGYRNRGLALLNKKQYDQAIADLDIAIKQDPKFISAYNDRASAYEGKGMYDRAVADRDAALKIDPNNMSTYRSRGYANTYMGRYDAAAADLARVVLKSPTDAYPVIWHYIALARAGNGTALTELQVDATKIKQSEWPYAVVELFLGKRDLDAMLAAASNNDQKCEAQYYGGMWNLIKKDNSRAAAMLKAAVDTCPKSFIEYNGATAELKRLGQ